MERTALNRTLIEAVVTRSLNEIERDPRRGIRKMVDLGAHLAIGRSQRRFLSLIRQLLNDESTPYYELIERLIRTTRRGNLKRFGIDLGYNSWTLGAAAIRRRELRHRHNIPWIITCLIGGSDGPGSGELLSLVEQGRAMGIYCYGLVFRTAAELSACSEVFHRFPDCAFFLFLAPELLNNTTAEQVAECDNLMLFIKAEPGLWPRAAARLSEQGTLHALYLPYTSAEEAEQALTGRLCDELAEHDGCILCLAAGSDLSPQTDRAVRDLVYAFRQTPTAPILAVDYITDCLAIDEIISEDFCLLFFAHGKTYCKTAQRIHTLDSDFRRQPLTRLLAEALPR